MAIMRLLFVFFNFASLSFGHWGPNVPSPPDCSAPCPAVKCLSPITPAGTCCPKCTEKPCLYKGKKYEHGETFKEVCNTCTCTNGSVSCTEKACLPKPGQCPTPDPEIAGICILGCTSDWDCSGAKKCCSNGCGMVCMLPIGEFSSKPNCKGVYCPELKCDDLYTPPGKCCEVCPGSIPLV